MSKCSRLAVHRLPPAFVVLSWIAVAPAVHATLTPQLSLEDLTHQADAIVIATATHTQSLWVERDLVTRVTLDVETTLLGDTSNPIHVLVAGGIDVNRRIPIASVVPGQPRIGHGERMLLFLRALEPDSTEFALVGDAQGRFTLLPDATGNDVAVRDLSAVRFVHEDGITRGRTTAVPVELLVEHLRVLLATNGR